MIKILIVEDDPLVVDCYTQYLARISGFKINAVARSGIEALTYLKEYKFDLVLLDVLLPGLNGLNLLSRIRKSNMEIDVILLTAACDSNCINKALRYGAIDYIIKPFEFERLVAALSLYQRRRSVIMSHGKLNQAQIDQYLLFRNETAPDEIPKGLDCKTLRTVRDNISQMGGRTFTTEELAKQVGISRVSMRKYIEFLERAGLLVLKVTYGSVGRPSHKYRYYRA